MEMEKLAKIEERKMREEEVRANKATLMQEGVVKGQNEDNQKNDIKINAYTDFITILMSLSILLYKSIRKVIEKFNCRLSYYITGSC